VPGISEPKFETCCIGLPISITTGKAEFLNHKHQSGIFCLGLPISIITVKFTERYNDLVHEWTIEEERVRLAKLDKKLAANRAVLGFGSVMASIIKKEGLVNQMMGLIPGRSKPTQEEAVKEVCKQVGLGCFRLCSKRVMIEWFASRSDSSVLVR
jgi:hypothetical protein